MRGVAAAAAAVQAGQPRAAVVVVAAAAVQVGQLEAVVFAAAAALWLLPLFAMPLQGGLQPPLLLQQRCCWTGSVVVAAVAAAAELQQVFAAGSCCNKITCICRIKLRTFFGQPSKLSDRLLIL